MSNWWKYTLTGVGCLVLGGTVGGLGMGYYGFKKGFDKGYHESEPEIMIFNYDQYGVEGMCVARNSREKVCAVDADNNGSIDVAVIDIETEEIKEVLLVGTDTCLNKYSRKIEKEKLNQEPHE